MGSSVCYLDFSLIKLFSPFAPLIPYRAFVALHAAAQPYRLFVSWSVSRQRSLGLRFGGAGGLVVPASTGSF